jgi:hypothetical protein
MEYTRRVLGIVGVLVCLAPARAVEAAPGTISGSVFGAGGSRLPGARIALMHQDTGQTFSVISGDRGLYRAANLPRGPYRVTASLSGFETKTVFPTRVRM